jgi:virginiamycin B lyase
LTIRDVPTRGAGPVGITATHDALWFTEILAGRIGRIADEAPIQELELDPESRPHAVIAAQADGVWVSLWGSGQIAHISDVGEIATLDLPPGSEPHGLAIGPDGALWVALEAGSVIRITS